MPSKMANTLSGKFWYRCVPARLVIAVALSLVPLTWLPLFGVAALFGAAGLLYRTVTYNRRQVGVFNQPVTWNAARPIHALLWLVFGILAISQNPRARVIPFIDVLVGIVAHCLLR